MKPLYVNPDFLRPLPKPMWGTACSTCDKPHSRWSVQVAGGDPVPSCSVCFLYDSFWGKPLRKSLDLMVTGVEVELGNVFARGEDGRVTRAEDADRVLGAIVMTSRLFRAHDAVPR
jgi:hypothetical protein